MPFLRKYNTLLVTGTTAIRVPVIKRASVDFAVSADWTPAAGDVKILVDGAAAANVTNLPTAVATANTGTVWEFVLTAAELSCKQCQVVISDAATKAVEDQSFLVETFGNASAMYVADLSLANLPANVTQLLGTAWATPATAGLPDVNVKQLSTDATAADNAEAFFDGTGYAGTGNTIPTVTTLTNLPAITANWLTAAGIAAAALNGKGDWNIGKTGYALSAAGVQAIWDALTSALTAVGSIGKKLADWVIGTTQTGDSYAIVNSGVHGNAALKTLIDTVDNFIDTEVAAILAAVDTEIGDIQARLPAALVAGRMDSSIGAAAANTLTASALATDAVTEIVDAVRAIVAVHSVGDPTSLEEILGLLKESVKNKLNVVKATGVMTLYKNDGVTARFAHTLVDDATNATRGAGV